MSGFFRFAGRRYGHGFADALKRSFGAVRSFLPFHREDDVQSEADAFRRSGANSAIRLVLSNDDGSADESKLDIFRQLIRDERLGDEVEDHIRTLRDIVPLPPEDTARAIRTFQDSEREKLMRFLLSLAAAAETSDKKVAELKSIFVMAGEDEDAFSRCRAETVLSEERRRRIIGSGAGIAVALVVILVFIITATLLRSVIFGLILAYILLPLEKYFERRERKKSGFVYYFFWLLSLPALPLRKLAQRLTRRSESDSEEKRREQERRNERRVITKAVAQTALTALVLICVLAAVLTRLTVHYVGDFKNNAGKLSVGGVSSRGTSTKSASADADGATGNYRLGSSDSTFINGMTGKGSAEAEKANPDGEDKEQERLTPFEKNFYRFVSWLEWRLGLFRDQLEKTPVFRFFLDQAILFLKDENSQKALIATVLKSSGGVFSFTAGVLSTVVTLLIDLLLTVFFALLFLMKLAEFCRDDESSGRKSEYLVRTVFNGNWLPGTNDVTLGEAKRILGGIMERIRVWARGYLTLVCVDATVYTTVFFFLRVPYFPILGIIAGCGILLPYIGPVISASLTLLVTLAVGNCTGLQLAGILAAYLFYNGIIEQFILYPAVIGESLGLTTLETIVVVLLGAVLAGIPGMLLALPAASVLKYLIPQIIQYLRLRKAAREETREERHQ